MSKSPFSIIMVDTMEDLLSLIFWAHERRLSYTASTSEPGWQIEVETPHGLSPDDIVTQATQRMSEGE